MIVAVMYVIIVFLKENPESYFKDSTGFEPVISAKSRSILMDPSM